LALDISAFFILLTALGLGLVHSLDPDHIVAVSTLVCNNRSLRKSISSAVVWGIGHSVVLILAGALVLLLRVAIPESVVNIFEFAAAILLIILGGYVLRPIIQERIHQHQHATNQPHDHTHHHEHGHTHSHSNEHGHIHLSKSALTGVLQGMGGTAALMLVTLTTVSTVEMGLIFILIFGVGVILGMMGVSLLVGSVITYTASKFERVHKIILAVTGSISIIVGIILMIELLI
jgi:ABC-type nickel/cobalt efflux system permease component RcnA